MNAVIYIRTDSPCDNSSNMQFNECIAYAEREGINVIGAYSDLIASGLNDNRLEFQRMMSDSNNKNFEAILVCKFSVFSRDFPDFIKYEKKLSENGVKVFSVADSSEYICPAGKILDEVRESINEEVRRRRVNE